MDLISIIPAFGGLLVTLAAFVAALSIIVAVHEYGHYIVARWSGIHSEVFSLGFGPVLLSRIDSRGTKWQIAAIPLGGYVKFRGDKNAASQADSAAAKMQSASERRSSLSGAPLWARTATVAAGPFFNFAFAILLLSGISIWQGQLRDPLTIETLHPTPFQHELKEGDVLRAINGQAVPEFDQPVAMQQFWNNLDGSTEYIYEIERSGRTLEVLGPNVNPPRVLRVMPRSAAADIGLQEGDFILNVQGDAIVTFGDLRRYVENSNGRPLPVTIWRNGQEINQTLVPKATDEPSSNGGFTSQWRIGVVGGGFFFDPVVSPLSLIDGLTVGLNGTWAIMSGSVSGLYHIVSGEISSCNLSGPIGIAETSGQMARQGGDNFLWFIAVLSAAVGMINLFPVPVLDGGHLVFFGYEALAGRPPNEAFLNALMMAGLAVILSFMMFALANDLVCP